MDGVREITATKAYETERLTRAGKIKERETDENHSVLDFLVKQKHLFWEHTNLNMMKNGSGVITPPESDGAPSAMNAFND